MASNPLGDGLILGAPGIDGKAVDLPSHDAINAFNDEKHRLALHDTELEKEISLDPEIKAALPAYDSGNRDDEDDHHIIVTGADAAAHLLSLRDDHEPALTFRSIFLASILSAFQAVVYQIYQVGSWLCDTNGKAQVLILMQFKPTLITIQGTFIVLMAYFLGKAWAKFLPRGDKFEARWRAKGGEGKAPFYIIVLSFFNHGPWGLKEHAITAITATSASIAAPSSQVFAAQDIFYNLPLKPVTVILSTISIGLFGYGICGILRPICVWHVESVYWSSLPTVKVLQGLHWQTVKDSKPLRWFWIAFSCMFAYELHLSLAELGVDSMLSRHACHWPQSSDTDQPFRRSHE
jgi:hypothetical protein